MFYEILRSNWLLVGFLAYLTMSLVGLVIVTAVLVCLPSDYFSESRPGFWMNAHPVLRWTGLIVKNIAGILTVAVGIILTLPGVPGPGLLTILLGIMLMDFSGRRRLERWLIRRPRVFVSINRLRVKYGRQPFALPPQLTH